MQYRGAPMSIMNEKYFSNTTVQFFYLNNGSDDLFVHEA